jgi:hypothetical protein
MHQKLPIVSDYSFKRRLVRYMGASYVQAIDERVFPGAAVAYGTCGKLCFSHGGLSDFFPSQF